jgi:hypothetical protein
MARRVVPIDIPQVVTVEELRRSVVLAMNRLAERFADQNFNSDINALNHRVTNLAAPVEGNDAVTKRWVENQVSGSSTSTESFKLPNDVLRLATGNLASIPTYGPADTGRLYYATDFAHLYWWTGTGWTWGPGDPGSTIIVLAGPSAPNAGVWQVCDGSTVTIALPDGTTGSYTVPDLTGDTFVYGGAYSGTVQEPSRATWEADATTAAAGTSATQIVDLGSGVFVTNDLHSHNLTNANARLMLPSETNGGLPRRMAMTFYFRC